MNILAHLYLADDSSTSAAGQILGDMVKGRLDGRYTATIENGIRLHRAIDSFTDQHKVTAKLRQRFVPPFRRYAGILVDIGFDYCLATQWSYYSHQPLPEFTRQAMARVGREWPAGAPCVIERFTGLDTVMNAYRQPPGLQRALDSVARRLRYDNPLPRALPALLHEYEQLAAGFDVFFPILRDHVNQLASRLSAS